MINWTLLCIIVIKPKTHTLYSARQGSEDFCEEAQINITSIHCLLYNIMKMSGKDAISPCSLWTIISMTHNSPFIGNSQWSVVCTHTNTQKCCLTNGFKYPKGFPN